MLKKKRSWPEKCQEHVALTKANNQMKLVTSMRNAASRGRATVFESASACQRWSWTTVNTGQKAGLPLFPFIKHHPEALPGPKGNG